jgi:hypothetical protein
MKPIVALLLLVAFAIILCSCGNMSVTHTTYTFDYAYIELPNGQIVQGEVDAWCNYGNNSVQVIIDDVVYLTHYENVVLVSK